MAATNTRSEKEIYGLGPAVTQQTRQSQGVVYRRPNKCSDVSSSNLRMAIPRIIPNIRLLKLCLAVSLIMKGRDSYAHGAVELPENHQIDRGK